MKKRTIDYKELQGLIHNICRDIANSNWRPDYVVGITRGGLLPAVMISHYLDVPMYTLKVSLKDDEHFESNLWMAEDAFGYVDKEDRSETVVWSDIDKRKNILIVDDINDTGRTIEWIKEDWQSGCLPIAKDIWASVWNANVRFAVVVDNQSSEFKDVDYIGLEINKNEVPACIDFPYEDWWTK